MFVFSQPCYVHGVEFKFEKIKKKLNHEERKLKPMDDESVYSINLL